MGVTLHGVVITLHGVVITLHGVVITLHGVVRLGIPFDLVLWVLKSSVPVSRKIQLGMPNVPGFSKS